MKPDKFIIGIAVISLFVLGGSFIFGDAIDQYDLSTTTEDAGFSSIYDNINSTYDIANDMRDDTFGAETQGTDQSWESLIKGAYSAVRLISNSFTLVNDMLNAVALWVGVPQFIVDITIIIILVAVVFSLIYMIFKSN